MSKKAPEYFLYLIEGDFSKDEEIDLYIIGKDDLLSMIQLKIKVKGRTERTSFQANVAS